MQPAIEARAVDGQQSIRPRSSTSNSSHRRPKSRGSTTSLQSVGVGAAYQPPQEQESHFPSEQTALYMHHNGMHGQPSYAHNTEEARLIHHLHIQNQSHSSVGHIGSQQLDLRPPSQHGFQDIPTQYAMHYSNGGLPQYPMHQSNMSHMHMRHPSENYMEGSPAPDDSNTETGGAKRRKGTASSLANDQELRRLLTQYQGKSLKDVAAEVQRNEGAGGKSEKAKQVFAMLWLQENCRRSTNSVRRDRVFLRYTARCGNERVPTLNPASFGKLVRIIFPNVQTRRLGVRGESKYHYVDLSLFPDDGEQYPISYQQPSAIESRRQDSSEEANRAYQSHTRSISDPHNKASVLETADFPAPSVDFDPQAIDEKLHPQAPLVKEDIVPMNMDCHYINTPTVRISIAGMPPSLVAALPSRRSNLPATLSTYLSMPIAGSHMLTPPSSQESFQLPDIHSYLGGATYDISIADSLSYLYRSYCIDVIDAFRKCKEKPFFNHHTAFNGKMTVPVSKLFSLEQVAPWIQECDMRMYKQMIRFIAPLALQMVPDAVWNVFDRVGRRLVSHLVTSFAEKCPTHVVVAKVVPAARFVNLLKKLKGANAAAMHVAGMLQEDKTRTQMWMDLIAMVDPEKVVDESVPPPETLGKVEGILSGDLKTLVDPLADDAVRATEEDTEVAYPRFMGERVNSIGVMPAGYFDHQSASSTLDRFVRWLEQLPKAFEHHHPQCMINWHTGFWKSIMTQLGVGGASTYQAWWYLEAFMNSMIGWLTQMEGLLLDETRQKDLDGREEEKRTQLENPSTEAGSGVQQKSKRKRDEEDVGGEERSRGNSQATSQGSHDGEATMDRSRAPSRLQTKQQLGGATKQTSIDQQQHHALLLPADDDNNSGEDDDDEMSQIRNSGPLDLPSFNTSSSPVKRQQQTRSAREHDDSGIDLGLDLEVESRNGSAGGEMGSSLKDEGEGSWKWGIPSDPVDGGEVVVI